MEIFAQEMRYRNGDFIAIKDPWQMPRLCVATTRRFFDLPTKKEIKRAQDGVLPLYVVSIHDKKKKHGVCIRIKPSTINNNRRGLDWGWGSDERKVQVERRDDEGHIGWSNLGFYHETTQKMLEMFDVSKKKSLYIVIEAV